MLVVSYIYSGKLERLERATCIFGFRRSFKRAVDGAGCFSRLFRKYGIFLSHVNSASPNQLCVKRALRRRLCLQSCLLLRLQALRDPELPGTTAGVFDVLIANFSPEYASNFNLKTIVFEAPFWRFIVLFVVCRVLNICKSRSYFDMWSVHIDSHWRHVAEKQYSELYHSRFKWLVWILLSRSLPSFVFPLFCILFLLNPFY